MLGRPATVLEQFDGRMIVRFEGKDLRYREIMEKEARPAPIPVRRPKPPKYTPPPTHPWRRYVERFPSSPPE